MLTTRPRGTNDILPDEAAQWQALERTIREVCRDFGYGEIRTPIFEHTELFARTAGEATDVVRKEMYTFLDRGDRSLTLRPEGTAAVVRAYLEHHLHARPQPVKLYYLSTPMFRYERPQAGRYRQHHQFGAEALGSADPALDAELITLPIELLRRLGLTGLAVKLNSIGCPVCRPGYLRALKAYFSPHLEALCADCRHRYELNPLRLLDCKVEGCRALRRDAPRILEHLCAECADHFRRLRGYLEALGIDYELEPTLVRGFDYYTKTVFEVVYGGLGAQDAVCGGGRYDGLVEALGGEPTPAIGFGLGMERLLLTLRAAGAEPPPPPPLAVFVASAGEETRRQAIELVYALRRRGVAADTDYGGRSLRSQMRFADRYPARFVAILGERELAAGEIPVRDMRSGEQQTLPWAELVERLAALAQAAEEGRA
ncbi:MAG TPA: histidine--tRNA ligase [Bacillota bacterium]